MLFVIFGGCGESYFYPRLKPKINFMNTTELSMNPNELVRFLKKLPENFTSADLVKFCKEKGIQVVNFRYVAEDGGLKTLNFFYYFRSLFTNHFNTRRTGGRK